MTTLLVKATTLAMAKHPVINSSCRDGNSFTYNSSVNIAVVVAVDGGLITLVLEDADKALGNLFWAGCSIDILGYKSLFGFEHFSFDACIRLTFTHCQENGS